MFGLGIGDDPGKAQDLSLQGRQRRALGDDQPQLHDRLIGAIHIPAIAQASLLFGLLESEVGFARGFPFVGDLDFDGAPVGSQALDASLEALHIHIQAGAAADQTVEDFRLGFDFLGDCAHVALQRPHLPMQRSIGRQFVFELGARDTRRIDQSEGRQGRIEAFRQGRPVGLGQVTHVERLGGLDAGAQNIVIKRVLFENIALDTLLQQWIDRRRCGFRRKLHPVGQIVHQEREGADDGEPDQL